MEEHKKAKNEATLQIAGAIVIAGVLIAGAILLKGLSGAPKAETPIAKLLGLKEKAFSSCVASEKFKNKVQADIDDGIKAGVSGTPTSFVLKDGATVTMIKGAQPFQNVKDMIKSISESEKGGKPLPSQPRPVTPSDHLIGNPNARIIIVEYSDLDCPFCKTFHNTMHQIIKENSDIAWVYRHYPIPQLHPNAFKRAEETECAWEQKGNEGFWEYTDKVFELAK